MHILFTAEHFKMKPMPGRMELTLRQYVKRRNKVALGALGSMTNMLNRSLGAATFATFWRHWNPIWGYYLGRYIYRPLRNIAAAWLATLFTFAISGALHDAAVGLIRAKVIFFFTPWFILMGFAVLLTTQLGIALPQQRWPVRAAFNLAIITGCCALTLWMESQFRHFA